MQMRVTGTMAGVLRQVWTGGLGVVLAGVILAAGSVFAVSARAQDAPKFLSEHHDWRAFTHDTARGKVCFMASSPKLAKGNYTRRGEIYAMVTHRPAENVRDEVSLAAGYDFPSGGQATVSISGQNFSMITQGEHAWATDTTADKKMVDAMRAGSSMVVKGRSARGTDTTDTYSLNGFTAAYNAISAACR
jgi:invasion protein IalB